MGGGGGGGLQIGLLVHVFLLLICAVKENEVKIYIHLYRSSNFHN
jgi:hypothetical protein